MNQIFKTISIYYLKIIIIEILIIYFNINYKNCLIYIINKFIDIIFLYYILKKYINNLNYNNQIQISIKPYNLFSINNRRNINNHLRITNISTNDTTNEHTNSPSNEPTNKPSNEPTNESSNEPSNVERLQGSRSRASEQSSLAVPTNETINETTNETTNETINETTNETINEITNESTNENQIYEIQIYRDHINRRLVNINQLNRNEINRDDLNINQYNLYQFNNYHIIDNQKIRYPTNGIYFFKYKNHDIFHGNFRFNKKDGYAIYYNNIVDCSFYQKWSNSKLIYSKKMNNNIIKFIEDIEITSNIEEFIDPITKDIMINPIKLNCNHMFDKITVINLNNNLCPLCRTDIINYEDINNVNKIQVKNKNISFSDLKQYYNLLLKYYL
jgi:hypothetical protein